MTQYIITVDGAAVDMQHWNGLMGEAQKERFICEWARERDISPRGVRLVRGKMSQHHCYAVFHKGGFVRNVVYLAELTPLQRQIAAKTWADENGVDHREVRLTPISNG